jgi:hypothetical protein
MTVEIRKAFEVIGARALVETRGNAVHRSRTGFGTIIGAADVHDATPEE